MTTLDPTPQGLLRQGSPHTIISGAVHYFRVHPELWRDRIRRVVAMGCNTLETYVAWNVHAPSPDEVTFDGWADLGRFLDIAAEEGLDAIVRPGPYICAEWEGGGFPGWLTADPTIRLRCLDERYLAAVDAWFDHLVPVIAERQTSRGGSVVAVQVENEYGSYGDDAGYLAHLRDGLRRRGIDELLVTSDGPSHAHLRGGRVEGAWPTLNFGSRTAEVLDFAAAELPDQPQMCMEFWNGWFDHWGEGHHTRSAASAAEELETMLAARMSVNFYMAHGGTNFGLWAGANNYGQLEPTVTSYDYDSPIAENGALTEKFHAFREVIGAHCELPELTEQLAQLGLVADPPALPARDLPWQQLVGLQQLPLWSEPGETHAQTPSFETLGLERGMQLLRRPIEVWREDGSQGEETSAKLVFHGLGDRAMVYLDGHFAGIADRNDALVEVRFDHLLDELLGGAERAEVSLEVLVENQARTNFGPRMGERKGITGGIWYQTSYLMTWQVSGWPLEQMGAQLADQAEGLSSGTDSQSADQPGRPLVGVAVLEAEEQADCFIDVQGCGRGVVWFDDFCLGRYWNIGPTRTMYVPSPLVTPGTHRITVLELESDAPVIRLAGQPDLGPAAG